MKRQLIPIVILLFSLLVLVVKPAGSQPFQYTEDFSSGQFCDVNNTTAHWDSTSGELELHPFQPHIVGSYALGDARSLMISGDYAYVTDWEAGLQVFDISDPTTPDRVGIYDTPDHADGIDVVGDYAYVADGLTGLLVIDISNPLSPTFAGSYDTPFAAMDVDVVGDYAYVANGMGGLVVLDVSDPTSPTYAGGCGTNGDARVVVVSGNYAYIADWTGGFSVVNVSNPASPSFVYNYDTPGISFRLDVDGDYAYVGDGSAGLQVFDISNPESPTLEKTLALPTNAYGVAVDGDYAYVANYTSGLQILNNRWPTSPYILWTVDTPSLCWDVAIDGVYAYVTDRYQGLQVVRTRTPSPPTIVGNEGTPRAHNLVVHGDYVFATDQEDGIRAINVSNPASPTLAGTYTMERYVNGIAIDGDYVYVTRGRRFEQSGVVVLDVSNPSSPALAGSVDLPVPPGEIVISGNHLYVTNQENGLYSINISNPALPAVVDNYVTSDYATGLDVEGDYAFVAIEHDGLAVVDISDPTNLTYAGGCGTAGTAYGVTVFGNYVFIGNHWSGVAVVGISDPTSPSVLGYYDTPDEAVYVCVSGDLAFVADDFSGGFIVLDVSDPPGPSLLWRDTGIYGMGEIRIAGDYAYTSSGGVGVNVVEVFQRDYDVDNNVAQSLPIDQADDTITEVKLTTTQTDSILWELSADGGVNWMEVPPDAEWHQFSVTGTDLKWRSTHVYTGDGSNPTCSHLDIEWNIDVPTLLRNSSVSFEGSFVEVAWVLSEAGIDMKSFVLRSVEGNGVFETLRDPDIQTEGLTFTFRDRDFEPGLTYVYRVDVEDEDGRRILFETDPVSIPAVSIALYQNHPNPFNPSTTISFVLPEKAETKLSIYDVEGRLVRTLSDGILDAGIKEYEWDGRDARGDLVSSGVYFYQLKSGKKVLTKKMVLLK